MRAVVFSSGIAHTLHNQVRLNHVTSFGQAVLNMIDDRGGDVDDGQVGSAVPGVDEFLEDCRLSSGDVDEIRRVYSGVHILAMSNVCRHDEFV